jgi:hypothetical protein
VSGGRCAIYPPAKSSLLRRLVVNGTGWEHEFYSAFLESFALRGFGWVVGCSEQLIARWSCSSNDGNLVEAGAVSSTAARVPPSFTLTARLLVSPGFRSSVIPSGGTLPDISDRRRTTGA